MGCSRRISRGVPDGSVSAKSLAKDKKEKRNRQHHRLELRRDVRNCFDPPKQFNAQRTRSLLASRPFEVTIVLLKISLISSWLPIF
jgi:hypothetical protein